MTEKAPDPAAGRHPGPPTRRDHAGGLTTNATTCHGELQHHTCQNSPATAPGSLVSGVAPDVTDTHPSRAGRLDVACQRPRAHPRAEASP